MSKEVFLEKAFQTHDIPSKVLWLNKTTKATAENILSHPIRALRIRYWKQGSRSAWILNEIGKEKPITIGIVVNDDRIDFIDILEFRESRGWEVRHPFFTKQFQGSELAEKSQGLRLSNHIDGITGATLSVAAVKRSSILALYLHSQLPRE